MRALLILGLVACGSRPPAPAPAPAAPVERTELSPALAPLAWWLGDWQAEASSEHWVASSGVIFGIALHDRGFEVLIVDDGEGRGQPDGILRLFAMPGGLRSVEFRARDVQASAITFANDAHDFPKAITYARDGDVLRATLGDGDRSEQFRFTRTQAPRAPELEAADVAFAADTAARGIDGWVAAFADTGGMMTKAGRIEGHAAIRELMGPLLATTRVTWAPIASARRGELGYTVGKATFTGKDESWRSTYVTIWQREQGAWRVVFDTGRTVQDQ